MSVSREGERKLSTLTVAVTLLFYQEERTASCSLPKAFVLVESWFGFYLLCDLIFIEDIYSFIKHLQLLLSAK